MPISFKIGVNVVAEAGDTALDPEQVYFQYICQTGPGQHDPNGAPDDHVRPAHAALHGTIWRLDDPSAPIPPIGYNCLLPGTKISGTFDGASRAFYSGKAFEIRTKNGAVLRVTANHPIVTSEGLCAAQFIKPGDKLAVNLSEIIPVSLEGVDEKDKPASVEKVFNLLSELGPVASVGIRADDFHGDAVSVNGHVDIVGSYALLKRVWDTHCGEHEADYSLAIGDSANPLPLLAFTEQGGQRGLSAFKSNGASGMSGATLRGTLSGRHAAPFDNFLLRLGAQLDAMGQKGSVDNASIKSKLPGYRIDGVPIDVSSADIIPIKGSLASLSFGLSTQFNPSLYQGETNAGASNPEFFHQLIDGNPGVIIADDVIDAIEFDFSGHVYDFRSVHGFIMANAAATSNCRCGMRLCAAPASGATSVLPTAQGEPEDDSLAPSERYLDDHAPEWKEVAKAAAKAPPGKAIDAAYDTAKQLGYSRDIAKMALEVDPPPAKLILGTGPLSGVGNAGRKLVERWRNGDMEAAEKLKKSYPATYVRILAEEGLQQPGVLQSLPGLLDRHRLKSA